MRMKMLLLKFLGFVGTGINADECTVVIASATRLAKGLPA